MQRTFLSLFIAFLTAAFITAVVFDDDAYAGTYEVLSCNEAPNGASGAWQSFVSGPAWSSVTTASCPPVFRIGNVDQAREVGLAAYGALSGRVEAQNGSSVGWRFTAPLSTTIVRLRYARYMGKFRDPDWRLFTRLADGTVIDTCHFDVLKGEDECAVGTPGSTVLSYDRSGLSTSSLETGFTCIPQPPAPVCSHGTTRHFVWATVYGSRVTISDPVSPRLGAVSGSLVDGSDRWRSGTDTATFSATDNVGIRETRVVVDGRAVSTQSRACDYTKTIPCMDEPGVTHRIDWQAAGVGDGRHGVEVVAVDAAGNEIKSTPVMVNVDTQPPLFPLNLSTSIPVQDGAVFPVSWVNPSQDGSPVNRADWRTCLENTPSFCVDGSVVGRDVHEAVVTVPGRGRWVTSVWLTDEAGNSSRSFAGVVTLENRDSRGPGEGPGGGGNGGGGGGEQPGVKKQTTLSFPSVKRDAKHRSRFFLSGNITPKELTGTLTIDLSFQPKRWKKTLTVQFAGGRWQTRVQLPKWVKKQRSFKGFRLAITYAGGTANGQQFLPAKTIRKL